jgi:hypothetical protein
MEEGVRVDEIADDDEKLKEKAEKLVRPIIYT